MTGEQCAALTGHHPLRLARRGIFYGLAPERRIIHSEINSRILMFITCYRIAMQKAELREAIAHRISQLSEKDRAAESRSICRRIIEALPQDPVTVCAYYAMPNEVDLKPLLDELLKKGFPLFLPRCESEKLVFRQVQDLSSLTKGSFDIPEPSTNASALDPQTASHVIVPGRAFDQKGGRLGRGNGGYDHWIADQRKTNPNTLYWGVCFECQLVPEVPMEAHDERVDAVVTARDIMKNSIDGSLS